MQPGSRTLYERLRLDQVLLGIWQAQVLEHIPTAGFVPLPALGPWPLGPLGISVNPETAGGPCFSGKPVDRYLISNLKILNSAVLRKPAGSRNAV